MSDFIRFSPSGKGLNKIFSEYQELALRAIWDNSEKGMVSREAWDYVNDNLSEGTISRASITLFLNELVDNGILTSESESCKGGFRLRYRPAMDEEQFKKHLAKTIIESLLRDFPDETRKAINESLNTVYA